MPSDERIYDGQLVFSAMDGDTSPSDLPDRFVSKAINRVFRGSRNRTRPSFRELELIGDAVVNEFIQSKPIQGSVIYRAVRPGTSDGMLVACGGRVFFGILQNNQIEFKQIAAGNDETVFNQWFVQAEDWVYIQDGLNNPLVWGGDINVQAVRLNPLQQEMPIGTIMEYIHGRVFVSDKYDQIYASDLIYANGFTDTTNTRRFTENEYWAEGGSFGIPLNLGRITGLKAMPSMDSNDRGQGELVIFCEEGAVSLNASLPRLQWKDARILRTSLVGRGNLSPWSLAAANSDFIMRSADGWAFYNNSRNEFRSGLSNRKISREVNIWADTDTAWMKQFASGIFFDNRFILTVNPFIVDDSNTTYGAHRPHSGMLVLDLDQASGSSPDSNFNFRWNGLWTGLRPIQLLSGFFNRENRAIAISYDCDGKNRFYDIDGNEPDDLIAGESVSIRSLIETRAYSFPGQSEFIDKRLNGGDLILEEIKQLGDISVYYRADGSPNWNYLHTAGIGMDVPANAVLGDKLQISDYKYAKVKLPSPNEKQCQPDTKKPANQGIEFQLRIEMTGAMTLKRFRISANKPTGPNETTPDCKPPTTIPTLSEEDSDFDFYQPLNC